jgi:hypothetical protein
MSRRLLLSLLVQAAVVSAALPTMAHDLSPASPITLSCQLHARTVGPAQVELRFDVRNPGSEAVHLLRWGTPFEGGWFAAFVSVRSPQGELAYQGAKVKRGEPAAEDYLRLAPGQVLSTRVRLEDAFDLSAQVNTELIVQSQWRWHDAIVGGRSKPPRPRDQHQGLEQACGTARIKL